MQTLQYRKYATRLCNESALWFLCRCMICQSQYYSVFLSLPVDKCPHLPFQLVKALYMADALSWPNSVKTRHQLGTVGVPVAGSCQKLKLCRKPTVSCADDPSSGTCFAFLFFCWIGMISNGKHHVPHPVNH